MPGPTSPCPCGLPATYADCCGALHNGTRTAATAEQLMRSRYSAFVVGDTAYLLRTWHSTTRPPQLELSPNIRWTGLEILSTTDGTPFHTEGTVSFRARYAGGAQQENSHFTREAGEWKYVGQ
ncbi:YchJ family protein [Kribbella sp. NPDC058245]|uniref:YchJ family protein n=1 Tax=Kribbella sp. NPDC058245 TaxID=3346399 RepID=UPI0036EBF569